MAKVPEVGTSAWRREGGDDDHFCPGCGTRQQLVARYPWYFCADCLKLAEDHQGRRLVFQSPAPLGGMSWRYADAPERAVECAAVVCLIRNREVIVREARFGGFVAEPYNAPLRGHNIVRLSRAEQSRENRTTTAGPKPVPGTRR
ncbi:hypothetical protein [Mesorhizobium sp. CAU 1741]|uniref:hypothetical protein n=1 Tax=Mesorhizobium sp. CAU 1741 TaxID=3140366 RepID=UPI00325C1836